MAEFNEGSLSNMLEGCEIEGGNKKKCRVRAGRHKKEKRRVETRERMIQEKEANREAEREEMAKVEKDRKKGIGSIKDKKCKSYAAYQRLEVSQTFLPNLRLKKEEVKNLEWLSRKMVKLLRWDLPTSDITYRKTDGSVSVAHLAHHFGVPEDILEKASSSDVGKGKQRMIVFEERVIGTQETERRIAALGGHSFGVKFPPGHKMIEKEDVEKFSPLVHETDAREKIEASMFLSAMHRAGGINFSVKKPGGYRRNANTIITINAEQLASAIASGFTFFHNEFSGLVFGLGRKNEDGSWDGKIPIEFLTFSTL